MLAGRDVTRDAPYRRAAAGLGRTFQVSSVFPRLTVFENARLAAEAAVGGTLRIWRRATGVRKAVERARWALGRVGLGAREQWPAGALAHGEKRKLELARGLCGDPRGVMPDEPEAGRSIGDVPPVL